MVRINRGDKLGSKTVYFLDDGAILYEESTVLLLGSTTLKVPTRSDSVVMEGA